MQCITPPRASVNDRVARLCEVFGREARLYYEHALAGCQPAHFPALGSDAPSERALLAGGAAAGAACVRDRRHKTSRNRTPGQSTSGIALTGTLAQADSVPRRGALPIGGSDRPRTAHAGAGVPVVLLLTQSTIRPW